MCSTRARAHGAPCLRLRFRAPPATRWAGTAVAGLVRAGAGQPPWPPAAGRARRGVRLRDRRVAAAAGRSRHAHGTDLGSRRLTADQPDPRHVGRRRGERMGRRLPQRRHPRRVRRNVGAAPGRARRECVRHRRAHRHRRALLRRLRLAAGRHYSLLAPRPRRRRGADSGATVVNAGRNLLVFGGARFDRRGGRLLRRTWTWSP